MKCYSSMSVMRSTIEHDWVYHMSKPIPVPVQLPQKLSNRPIIRNRISHWFHTFKQIVAVGISENLPMVVRTLDSLISKVVDAIAIRLPHIH